MGQIFVFVALHGFSFSKNDHCLQCLRFPITLWSITGFFIIAQGSNQAHRNYKMRSIFPLSRCQKNLILLFSRCKTFCKPRENTYELHLYCWDHVYKVNEWCLVDCFHREFGVSTQIILRHCIAKYKKFSAYCIL